MRRLESAVRAAEARLANARTEFNRYSRLLAQRAASRQDMERRETEFQVARQELQATRDALEKGSSGREEDIAAKQAAVRGLEARGVEANLQLQDTTLRAPYDGEQTALIELSLRRMACAARASWRFRPPYSSPCMTATTSVSPSPSGRLRRCGSIRLPKSTPWARPPNAARSFQRKDSNNSPRSSFWLLMPGTLGLFSIKKLLNDPGNLGDLLSVVFALASIAPGTLVGASLYKWLTERFGAWRLQIGRVGTYFRRKQKP